MLGVYLSCIAIMSATAEQQHTQAHTAGGHAQGHNNHNDSTPLDTNTQLQLEAVAQVNEIHFYSSAAEASDGTDNDVSSLPHPPHSKQPHADIPSHTHHACDRHTHHTCSSTQAHTHTHTAAGRPAEPQPQQSHPCRTPNKTLVTPLDTQQLSLTRSHLFRSSSRCLWREFLRMCCSINLQRVPSGSRASSTCMCRKHTTIKVSGQGLWVGCVQTPDPSSYFLGSHVHHHRASRALTCPVPCTQSAAATHAARLEHMCAP